MTRRFAIALWQRGIALVTSVVLLTGCGEEPKPLLPTFAVTGQVLYANGQPLPSGIIQFVSKTEPNMNMSAIIGTDGSFELQTIQGNTSEAGAIEGECEVMVTLPLTPDKPPETIILPKTFQIGQQENRFVIRLDRTAN